MAITPAMATRRFCPPDSSKGDFPACPPATQQTGRPRAPGGRPPSRPAPCFWGRRRYPYRWSPQRAGTPGTEIPVPPGSGSGGCALALPDIPALEEDAAGGGLEQPVEVLDEGGFARAGVADDAQVLPAVGGKVHVHQGPVFKGGTGGIDVAQALRLNDRFQWLHSFIIWCMPAGHARVCSRSKSAWAHSSSLSASRGTSTPPAGAATAARWSRGQ